MNQGYIYFRTDWSSSLGYGHLFRCMSFAENIQVPLIIISNSDISKSLLPKNISVYSVEKSRDLVGSNDWVIIDSYAISENEEKGWYHRCNVLAIDDAGHRYRWCHKLIDYAMHNSSYYKNLTPEGTKHYLGEKYLLIHPQFKKSSWKYRDKVETVLITVGGADLNYDTLKILNKYESDLNKFNLKVLIGPGFSKELQNTLKERVKKWKGQLMMLHSKTLWEEYHKVDALIGAYGVSSWERIWIGLPSLNQSIVSNQLYNKRIQESKGLASSRSFNQYLELRYQIHRKCLEYFSSTELSLKEVLV